MTAKAAKNQLLRIVVSGTFHSIAKLTEESGMSEAGSDRKTRHPQGDQSGVCLAWWQCLMSCGVLWPRWVQKRTLSKSVPPDSHITGSWLGRAAAPVTQQEEFPGSVTAFCRDLS